MRNDMPSTEPTVVAERAAPDDLVIRASAMAGQIVDLGRQMDAADCVPAHRRLASRQVVAKKDLARLLAPALLAGRDDLLEAALAATEPESLDVLRSAIADQALTVGNASFRGGSGPVRLSLVVIPLATQVLAGTAPPTLVRDFPALLSSLREPGALPNSANFVLCGALLSDEDLRQPYSVWWAWTRAMVAGFSGEPAGLPVPGPSAVAMESLSESRYLLGMVDDESLVHMSQQADWPDSLERAICGDGLVAAKPGPMRRLDAAIVQNTH